MFCEMRFMHCAGAHVILSIYLMQL